MSDPKRIGLLVGRERSFPAAFIEEVNRREAGGVSAGMCLLGGTQIDDPRQYAVLVDRISHRVPYYRSYAKYAALAGAAVINNPFWWSADEKFFATALAARLGVAVPRSVVLPNKEYGPGITGESLQNLRYPLPWDEIVAYVGLPAILRPSAGRRYGHFSKVWSLEELWRCYDQTGQATMMLQEHIDCARYVRCLCIGRREVLPIHWDPGLPPGERYAAGADPLAPALEERLARDARLICDALGFDVNAVDFAVRDGIPYAIGFHNPVPDFDRDTIRDAAFSWVVEKLADLAIAYAQGGGSPPGRMRWDRFLRECGSEDGR